MSEVQNITYAKVLKAFILAPLISLAPWLFILSAAFFEVPQLIWIIGLPLAVALVFLGIPVFTLFVKKGIFKAKFYVLAAALCGLLSYPVIAVFNSLTDGSVTEISNVYWPLNNVMLAIMATLGSFHGAMAGVVFHHFAFSD